MVNEKKYIILLHFLPVPHAFALSGSIGHAIFLARYCNMPPIVSIMPAKINTSILWADIQIKPGTLDASDAITLPAPRATSVAGKAQHINVLAELNRVKKSRVFFIIFF